MILYLIFYFTENKRFLIGAKMALKKSKKKDYYKILGIDKNASTDDIKKAYRKRAMVHHPGIKLLIILIYKKRIHKIANHSVYSKKKKNG